jgi:hypothetical protein
MQERVCLDSTEGIGTLNLLPHPCPLPEGEGERWETRKCMENNASGNKASENICADSLSIRGAHL